MIKPRTRGPETNGMTWTHYISTLIRSSTELANASHRLGLRPDDPATIHDHQRAALAFQGTASAVLETMRQAELNAASTAR